ncbi:TPA: hypothetical protein EYP66_12600 [Candidatus Poribacteria bacterium]|nr:hypothetical protein [Candidatus Poribacteria bacterium]
MMRSPVFLSLFIMIAIVISGCVAFQTGISTSTYLDTTTSFDKRRTYEYRYDDVFEAAFNAAQKSGLWISVADKKMGAIHAEKHIGAYTSGWHEFYGIYLKEEKEQTVVQVKYKYAREGLPFVPLSTKQSVHDTSFTMVTWNSSSAKINDVFTKIERELGIKDIWGVRGLGWY